MLNDENNEGKGSDDDEEVTTSAKQHHPASTTCKQPKCCSRLSVLLNDARNWIRMSKNIDRMSRRVFPATFLVFNIVYWSVYLTPPQYHCDLEKHHINLTSCFTTQDPILSSERAERDNG